MDDQEYHAGLFGTFETDEVVAAAQCSELHDGGNAAGDFAKHTPPDSGKPIIGISKYISVGIGNKPTDRIFARRAT
jgi:hypothetical protein